jgi:hypothetical protein
MGREGSSCAIVQVKKLLFSLSLSLLAWRDMPKKESTHVF